jgi:hypothetical protein
MNSGEIRVPRFERAQRGAETIAADLRINAPAQLIVIDEKMSIIMAVFAAITHGQLRPHREPLELGAADSSGPLQWLDVGDRARQRS